MQGLPWKWNPEGPNPEHEMKVRWLTEEDRANSSVWNEEGEKRIYRMGLKKSDCLEHGFTQGCLGCQALISGATATGHLEGCRNRMEADISASVAGRARRERQVESENEKLARRLEREFGAKDAERQSKKQRRASIDSRGPPSHAQPSSSSSSSSFSPTLAQTSKKQTDSDLQWGVYSEKRSRKEDPDEDATMSLVERLMQEDVRWTVSEIGDMCAPECPEVQRCIADMSYYDEVTWEVLDPVKVERGEREELARVHKMGVYEYVDRHAAQKDPNAKFAKIKWVRINKGSPDDQEDRCRLVAHELGYGENGGALCRDSFIVHGPSGDATCPQGGSEDGEQ